MKVYNTLTKQKEEFVPVEPGKIKMYVCGPTVYNVIHIGNARPFIVFDVARRYFEYKGFEVTYVQNYTDVDDKIIQKANQEGVTSDDIANRYIDLIEEDAKGLGVRPATHNPKATEEIPGMIEMIETLIEKGYAYAVDGSVYFATRKFEGYGKLSKKNPDDLEAGARIAVDSNKRNPMDFVLWKPKKEGEPAWSSPWGEGRPGWHLECSVMAKRYLGETIDIHAGGTDLVFPHHENEIAQSEAANGVPFANYWLHNGFINVDNKKMSKSTGNFFTVKDIVKEYDYEVVRFFMLNAHYRSPVNFSRELMDSAANGLKRLRTGLSSLKHALEHTNVNELVETEKEAVKALKEYDEKFVAAMDDDFNTADAIAALFEIIRYANTNINSESSQTLIQSFIDKLTSLSDVIGVAIEVKAEILDSEIEALIEARQEARKNRDFAKADEIRHTLLDQGIILEDTREGVKYRRA